MSTYTTGVASNTANRNKFYGIPEKDEDKKAEALVASTVLPTGKSPASRSATLGPTPVGMGHEDPYESGPFVDKFNHYTKNDPTFSKTWSDLTNFAGTQGFDVQEGALPEGLIKARMNKELANHVQAEDSRRMQLAAKQFSETQEPEEEEPSFYEKTFEQPTTLKEFRPGIYDKIDGTTGPAKKSDPSVDGTTGPAKQVPTPTPEEPSWWNKNFVQPTPASEFPGPDAQKREGFGVNQAIGEALAGGKDSNTASQENPQLIQPGTTDVPVSGPTGGEKPNINPPALLQRPPTPGEGALSPNTKPSANKLIEGVGEEDARKSAGALTQEAKSFAEEKSKTAKEPAPKPYQVVKNEFTGLDYDPEKELQGTIDNIGSYEDLFGVDKEITNTKKANSSILSLSYDQGKNTKNMENTEPNWYKDPSFYKAAGQFLLSLASYGGDMGAAFKAANQTYSDDKALIKREGMLEELGEVYTPASIEQYVRDGKSQTLVELSKQERAQLLNQSTRQSIEKGEIGILSDTIGLQDEMYDLDLKQQLTPQQRSQMEIANKRFEQEMKLKNLTVAEKRVAIQDRKIDLKTKTNHLKEIDAQIKSFGGDGTSGRKNVFSAKMGMSAPAIKRGTINFNNFLREKVGNLRGEDGELTADRYPMAGMLGDFYATLKSDDITKAVLDNGIKAYADENDLDERQMALLKQASVREMAVIRGMYPGAESLSQSQITGTRDLLFPSTGDSPAEIRSQAVNRIVEPLLRNIGAADQAIGKSFDAEDKRRLGELSGTLTADKWGIDDQGRDIIVPSDYTINSLNKVLGIGPKDKKFLTKGEPIRMEDLLDKLLKYDRGDRDQSAAILKALKATKLNIGKELAGL